MGKSFDRVEITCNDDDTYTVQFYPYVAPKKSETGDGPQAVSSYDQRKTITADSLDSAMEKIKSMSNGKSPEKEMNRFFNGEESEESDESN